MLTPRHLLILPLGALSMFATLSSQNAPQTAQLESTIQQLGQEVCTPLAKADICIVSEKAAR